ncbi:MAG: NfeD family protein [Ruminococcaceae bacterium]|nr:NfeD family protein [Oscillospiraceae bacterium]
MPPLVIMWLAAIVVFAVLEAATAALVSIWFVVGSVVGLILALFGIEFQIQFLVFLIVSALVLAVVRPIARKYLTPKKVSTNYDRYIGSAAIVTETIDNIHSTGAVKIGGVEWTARAESGEIIPKDSLVKITAIEGVKLLVVPETTVKEGD